MKYYNVSIDFTQAQPIPYQNIIEMAFDPNTENDYADYLQYVLKKAKQATGIVKETIQDVQFYIHKTGCIIPFGEGSFHAYSKNFYKLAPESELPNIPFDRRKAS